MVPPTTDAVNRPARDALRATLNWVTNAPGDAAAYAALADLLMAVGQPGLAVLAINKALTSEPDVARHHAVRGAALAALGFLAAGRADYARAAALEPENPGYARLVASQPDHASPSAAG